MKVFINGISALQGGGVTYLNSILKELLKYDDLYMEVWGFSKIDPQMKNDRLHLVPLNGVHSSIIRRFFCERITMSKHLRNENFDIAFFPNGSITSAVPKHTKSVTMFRNMLPFNKHILSYYGLSYRSVRLELLRYLFIKSYQKADSTIFISNYAREVIKKYVPHIDQKSEIIPHGTASQFMVRDIATTKNESYFVYVSIFTHYKHQKELVQAVKVFFDKHSFAPKIVMYGYSLGTYKAEVEQMIIEYGLDAYIQVKGSLLYQDIPEVYMKSQGIIFASSCENCPNILLEMMATGKTILCSEIQPMPEFLGNGGIYFNPYDVDSMVKAIEKVLIEKVDTRPFRKAAQKNSKKFTWERTAKNTYEHFKSLITNETNHSRP